MNRQHWYGYAAIVITACVAILFGAPIGAVLGDIMFASPWLGALTGGVVGLLAGLTALMLDR